MFRNRRRPVFWRTALNCVVSRGLAAVFLHDNLKLYRIIGPGKSHEDGFVCWKSERLRGEETEQRIICKLVIDEVQKFSRKILRLAGVRFSGL